jgi:hypothetical protein
MNPAEDDRLVSASNVGVAEHIPEEPVKRIVASISPRRIILFGSAARGTVRPQCASTS